MLSSLRPRTIVFALALALGAAFPFFTFTASERGDYFFEISAASNTAGIIQIYYETGHGYSEADSETQALAAGTDPVVYRFALPTGTYWGLRFDPIDREGTVAFSDAKIVDRNGKVIRRFPPADFFPAHQIASLIPKNNGLEMRTTPGDNDPYLVLSIPSPFRLAGKFDLLRQVLFSLPAFFIIFLGVLIAGSFSWDRKNPGQSDKINPGKPAAEKPRSSQIRPIDWCLASTMVALVLFKLWLVSAQGIFALGGADHDDELFINLAHSLLHGQWLGHYTEFTLMKGPMYSIFIACTYLLGVPLFTAQHLLYAAGCALTVWAFRPLISSRWVRFGLFVALLFNPVTYEGSVHMRVLRQDILPGLVLLIVAGFTGLYARHAGPKRSLLFWALLAGTALPAFWLTREEGVWLLPCFGLLWAAAGLAVWRNRVVDRRERLALVALPAVLWAVGLGLVSWLNLHCYGTFTTCEFKQADFKAAFGALLRVEPQQWRPYIAVPREARERLYAVSPAFAELRPLLEGKLGEDWAQDSQWLTHILPKEHEIAVGWFMWALRDAVFSTGHAHSGAEAMAFYAKIAREINDACDSGKVKAGPRRSGFLPPLRHEYLRPFYYGAQRSALLFFSFDQMTVASAPSIGTPEQLARFAHLTHGFLNPPSDGTPFPPQKPHRHVEERLSILEEIMHFYHAIALWAIWAAMLALLAAIGIAITHRRPSYFAVASIGLLGSGLALVTICTLVEVTSFPAINIVYFTGGYGLLILFMFTSWLALAEVLRAKPRP
jgi:hypothetical protein